MILHCPKNGQWNFKKKLLFGSTLLTFSNLFPPPASLVMIQKNAKKKQVYKNKNAIFERNSATKIVKSQHLFHSFLFRASVRNPSSRSRSMRRSIKTHQSGDTYSVGDSLVSYSISDQERYVTTVRAPS